MQQSRGWRRRIPCELRGSTLVLPFFSSHFTPSRRTQLRRLPTCLSIPHTLLCTVLHKFWYYSFFHSCYKFIFVFRFWVHRLATSAVRARPSCQLLTGDLEHHEKLQSNPTCCISPVYRFLSLKWGYPYNGVYHNVHRRNTCSMCHHFLHCISLW